MSRIFLIHGWTGTTQKDWFPWAKKELEKQGYEVFVPALPDTHYPRIKPWIEKLQKVVGVPRTDDIFVGHSMGCQCILRYLETQPTGTKINKVILIAGFEELKEAAFEVPEDRVIFKPWHDTPIDYEKIKGMPISWIALYSDDDPVVPSKVNAKIFRKKLGAKIVFQNGMGHFNQEAGIYKLPILLELVK
jgi:predicted alpha/beta hydrolase family esterase